jgi:hypothetical protein
VPYGSPNNTRLGPAHCHIPLCVGAKGPVLRYTEWSFSVLEHHETQRARSPNVAHYRKCGNERTGDACHLAALPDVARTNVALNAVADEGAIESELITGLSIEGRGRAKLCQGKNGFGKSRTALKQFG